MIDSKSLEELELMSATFIDLDDKSYQEYGELLKRIEPIINPLLEIVPEEVNIAYRNLITGVEALILQEIEPIDNLEEHLSNIYKAFEQIKDFFYSGKIPNVEENINNEDSGTSDKEQVEEQEMEIEDDMFSDFLEEASEYINDLEGGIIELEEQPESIDIINEVFRPFHTLKGVSGFMGLKKMNKLCHETETLLDMARNSKISVTSVFIDAVFKAIDVLKTILEGLEPEERTEKIDDDKLNDILEILAAIQQNKEVEIKNEVVIENEPGNNDVENNEKKNIVKNKNVENKKTSKVTPSKIGKEKSTTSDSSIKIKTEKLDYLINTVGELLIASNLIKQDKHILSNNDQVFTSKIGQLARVVSELQNAAMALRMVPIGTTFQKMKRVVRDLSKKTNKAFILNLEGEETEIDRHLVDSLYDPLVHMIRNSCDHGIESGEERLKAGKSESGSIFLKAYHKGNNFVIDVKDDGKGLDRDRILKKALERNLIDESDKLSDEQIYKLVLLPGFSTAQKVTDVSGRGVGMDVVVQSIKSLGGDINIASEPGLGTTFTMSIPLTLAIIEGLQVDVRGQLFVIPINQVNRFVRVDVSKINSVIGQVKTIKIEENLIPILSLEVAFNLDDENIDLESSLLVVVSSGEKKFAIRVDKILSIQDIVVKNLGDKFKNLRGVSGATILGDGSVGLILDVNQIFVENA